MAEGDNFKKSPFPVVDVTIQEKDDLGFDKKLNISDEEVIHFASIEKAFILKGAMASGRASVTLYANINGIHTALETSAAMLKTIADLANNL